MNTVSSTSTPAWEGSDDTTKDHSVSEELQILQIEIKE
jgi:hypothetical protein